MESGALHETTHQDPLVQMRRQLEQGRGGGLVIACADHVDTVEVFTRGAAAMGELVLRIPGPDVLRPGVRDAISLAATSGPLTHLTVLAHSGCRHALACCPDLPSTSEDVLDIDVMVRLTAGVVRHQRQIEAARRTLRAQVRALSSMDVLGSAVQQGAVAIHGAVLLVESGQWLHYHPARDAFVGDLSALQA